MGRLRILITGINGTIGRAIVNGRQDTWDITGLDVVPGHGAHIADIADWGKIDAVFDSAGRLDGVVHLAAIASSRASWDDVLVRNIVGTRNVYESAKNHRVPRVVFASSWHVVGGYHMHRETGGLVTVTDPVRPDGDYATSKAFGEALARQYWEQFGVRSVCLRIGNVEANDRPRDEHAERIWLSHRDLVQLVERSLSADVDFGIYFATSGNTGGFLDLGPTERELGYVPQDDSSELP